MIMIVGVNGGGKTTSLGKELLFVFMVNLHIFGWKTSACARKKSGYTIVAAA